ncbi:MAG: NADP-dependent isocitrate dehydrogenase [Deltaproteobacteria bacterium]|jgi:isocitrate dehydrogenase|nr:NADP-dependent isocitrate dehydrogenase [Deltaproteobacteria bacterium]
MTVGQDQEKINLSDPQTVTIVKIEGDGVGPEIWRASQAVFEEAARLSGRQIVWRPALAGEAAFKETGSPLPEATLNDLKHFRIGLKGPLGTPVGGGLRSLNVALRQALDLYACVRPVKWLTGVPSPVKNPHLVDMILFRENAEDVYAGLEWPAKSSEAKKLIEFLKEELKVPLAPDSAVGLKPMSEIGSKKLIRLAITWALRENRPSLTLVHKGNIMKYTEGAFRRWGYELAAEEFGGQTRPLADVVPGSEDNRLIIKDCLADNMFMQVLTRPAEYSVLACPNLNGDYLSDALAAQVGGLGVAPGANLGDDLGLFEATHGTVPPRAGLNIVNPSSLLFSGALAFDWLGWTKAAQSLRAAIAQTVQDGLMTYDLARYTGQEPISCSAFGEAVLARLR